MKREKRKTKKAIKTRRSFDHKGGLKALPGNLLLDILRNKVLYLFLLVILLYFILFHYLPMFGIYYSFTKYTIIIRL